MWGIAQQNGACLNLKFSAFQLELFTFAFEGLHFSSLFSNFLWELDNFYCSSLTSDSEFLCSYGNNKIAKLIVSVDRGMGKRLVSVVKKDQIINIIRSKAIKFSKRRRWILRAQKSASHRNSSKDQVHKGLAYKESRANPSDFGEVFKNFHKKFWKITI